MADFASASSVTEGGPITLSWRRRLLHWLRLALIVYLGVVLVLLLLENSMVYQRVSALEHWEPPPSPEIEDVDLTSADGTAIHGWWLPVPGATSTLLYLHGNAGNLSMRGGNMLKIREELGASVMIIDYPGYGKSGGRPSEQGCYAAADAAYVWLTDQQKVPPDRILVWGISLGGGVAVDLAGRKDCRALILVKTFTSLPDVAGTLYPWLPTRWLMRNRFPSLDKIAACKRPVFITHGTTDNLIPYALSERLFEAAQAPKTFFALDKHGHNDPLSKEMFDELNKFLAKHAP